MRISTETIKTELEGTALAGMNRLFANVPFAREFHNGQATHLAYYRRHLVETVVRMRLDIQTDAYALFKMRPLDNELSCKFALYLSEEAGHDELFLADIQRFGISREEALSTPPFQATENLIGYFYYHINHVGPMLSVLWGWLVEWYSDNYNGNITRKASDEFGAAKLKGSAAHLAIDDQKDHRAFMLSTVVHLIRDDKDLLAANAIISRLTDFLADYFFELHQTTIGLEAKAS